MSAGAGAGGKIEAQQIISQLAKLEVKPPRRVLGGPRRRHRKVPTLTFRKALQPGWREDLERAVVWARALYTYDPGLKDLEWPFQHYDIVWFNDEWWERGRRGRPKDRRVEDVYHVARQLWWFEWCFRWDPAFYGGHPANVAAEFLAAFGRAVHPAITATKLHSVHDRWRREQLALGRLRRRPSPTPARNTPGGDRRPF